jgi:hypothetical protein
MNKRVEIKQAPTHLYRLSNIKFVNFIKHENGQRSYGNIKLGGIEFWVDVSGSDISFVLVEGDVYLCWGGTRNVVVKYLDEIEGKTPSKNPRETVAGFLNSLSNGVETHTDLNQSPQYTWVFNLSIQDIVDEQTQILFHGTEGREIKKLLIANAKGQWILKRNRGADIWVNKISEQVSIVMYVGSIGRNKKYRHSYVVWRGNVVNLTDFIPNRDLVRAYTRLWRFIIEKSMQDRLAVYDVIEEAMESIEWVGRITYYLPSQQA